jgi:hypothetical protein
MMETTEYIEEVNVSPTAIGILVGIASFGVGVGVGYLLGKRNKDVVYRPVQTENAGTTTTVTYDYSYSEDVVTTDATIDEEVIETAIQAEYADEIIEGTRVIPEERLPVNIWSETSDGVWDYELELSNRNPTDPYVIHQDEFMADEMDFRQSTITYYQGDDIMADEHDTHIYNYNNVVGDLKFGHGSKDPHVVYARNEAMRMEWEILLHTGKFSVEVAGIDADIELERDSLKHSNSLHKFRDF